MKMEPHLIPHTINKLKRLKSFNRRPEILKPLEGRSGENLNTLVAMRFLDEIPKNDNKKSKNRQMALS